MIKFDRLDEIKNMTNFGFMTQDPWLILAKIYDLSQRLFEKEIAELAYQEFKNGLKQLKDDELIEPFRSIASYYLNPTHADSVAKIFKIIHDIYVFNPEVYNTKKKKQMCELGYEVMELYTEYDIPFEEFMAEFNELFEFFVEFITSKARKKYIEFVDYQIVKDQIEEKKEVLKGSPEFATNFQISRIDESLPDDEFIKFKSDTGRLLY